MTNQIFGDDNDNNIVGTVGRDMIYGRGGNDTLDGGAGDDVLYGGAGNDTLFGGAGDDQLSGDAGADTMHGGTGNDTYYVDDVGDMVIERNGEGIDTVVSTISYTLGASVENLRLDGTDNINGTGNALNNTIIGNAGNNILFGNAGNDSINGGAGDDTINGGSGNDWLHGGSGIDLLTYRFGLGSSAGVTVDLSITTSQDTGAGGRDTILGIENLEGTNANDVLRGNNLDNVISGLGGNDKLFGGGGNDTLVGSSGSDELNGGAGMDMTSWSNLTFEGTGSHVAGVVLNLSSQEIEYNSGQNRGDSHIFDEAGNRYEADGDPVGHAGFGGNIARDVMSNTAAHKDINNWLESVDKLDSVEKFIGSSQTNDVAVLDASFQSVSGEAGWQTYSDGMQTYAFQGFETIVVLS
jgi:serralysin